MQKVNRSVAVIALLLISAVVALLAWRGQRLPTPPAAPAVEVAPAPPQPVEPAGAGRYPISHAQGEAGTAGETLPALDQSDAALMRAIQAMVHGDLAAAIFNPHDIARRIVATIDNLPRSRVPSRIMAVRPAEGLLVVSGDNGELVLDPRNEARYTRYMDVLDEIDLAPAVGLYVQFYPLLQQAYRELGYPNGYFNDRVIEAVDDMLAAPVPDEPLRLEQPHVLYTFADPDLEARSSGQKIMLRIGAGNAQRVKAKLRELRSRLTGISR